MYGINDLDKQMKQGLNNMSQQNTMTVTYALISKEDDILCRDIAVKAGNIVDDLDILTTHMDLLVCHTQACELDLVKLLDADNFNMLHDILGINRHLNRDTGQLLNCFLPRFAKNY